MDNKTKEFLKTKAGKYWFYKQTPELNRKQRNELKNRLINPPKNVLNWLEWDNKIKKAFKMFNDFKYE